MNKKVMLAGLTVISLWSGTVLPLGIPTLDPDCIRGAVAGLANFVVLSCIPKEYRCAVGSVECLAGATFCLYGAKRCLDMAKRRNERAALTKSYFLLFEKGVAKHYPPGKEKLEAEQQCQEGKKVAEDMEKRADDFANEAKQLVGVAIYCGIISVFSAACHYHYNRVSRAS